MSLAYQGLTKLLSAASTDEVSAGVDLTDDVQYVTVYIEWGAGTGAGVVQIEEAPHAEYAGTWAPVQELTWAQASVTDAVHLTGAYAALRVRITTGVTGGSINAYLLAR